MEKQEPVKDAETTLLKHTEQLNISLIIDTYEDIFSNFDPRPFGERALSEDFLQEVRRRRIPHRKGGLEVRFAIPDKERDPKTEAVIKRRLKGYFREEEKILSGRVRAKKRRGYLYIGIGTILLLVIAFVLFNYEDNLWARLFDLLLAPAAWFGMWEGIGKVVERDENLEIQLELARKLSESVFVFIPESEALKALGQAEPGAQLKESPKENVAKTVPVAVPKDG